MIFPVRLHAEFDQFFELIDQQKTVTVSAFEFRFDLPEKPMHAFISDGIDEGLNSGSISAAKHGLQHGCRQVLNR